MLTAINSKATYSNKVVGPKSNHYSNGECNMSESTSTDQIKPVTHIQNMIVISNDYIKIS